MPHDIFISYSRRDLAAVKPIKEELEVQGFSCWMDLEGIESGAEEFTKCIVSAIESSSAFLFLLSASSQSSEWSLKELRFAKESKKRVVLVRFTDDAMTPVFSFNFGGSDIIDWRVPEQKTKLFRDLANWSDSSNKLCASKEARTRHEGDGREARYGDAEGSQASATRSRRRLWRWVIALVLVASVIVCGVIACGIVMDMMDNPYAEFSNDGETLRFYHTRNGSRSTYAIPDSVKSIGDFSFRENRSLKSVTIPDSVSSIGYSAFADCKNLTSVTIGNGTTQIGDYAFYNCRNLTSIAIPDSVKIVGDSAFYGCRELKSAVIGNGVTIIAKEAFKGCDSMRSVTMGNCVAQIGQAAFSYCTSLTSVTIPDSVTGIGASAFSDCSSLTSVTIPNSVTSIGASAFRDCKYLTSITIPDSVTAIGDNAFLGCPLNPEVKSKLKSRWPYCID